MIGLLALLFVVEVDVAIVLLALIVSPREMRGFYRDERHKMWLEFLQGWNEAMLPLRRHP